MNVNFKVYWSNPIDMVTEAEPQPLTFEVPLGAIISNPSGGGDLTNYYTKAETNTEITNAVSAKADTTYVDSANSLQDTIISSKADKIYVDNQNALQDTTIASKADKSYVDSENTKQNEVITTKASTSYVDTEIASVKTKETVINALGYTPAPTRKTVNPQSVSYQLQLSDANNIVRTTGATATNITVPNAATVAWTPQDRVEVEWYGAGQPTIVAGSGVSIRVAGGGSLTYSNRYETGILEYIGADEWVLYKDDLGGGTSTTWVNIDTLTGYSKNANVSVSDTKIEVAKFDGLLWIRGFIATTKLLSANTELFIWSDTNYLWDYVPISSTFPYDMLLNRLSMYELVDYQVVIRQNYGGTGRDMLRFFANQAYGSAIAVGVIPPTPIGKHL